MNELFREISGRNKKAVKPGAECRCYQINNIKSWHCYINGNETICKIVIHENKEQKPLKKEQNRL